MRKYSFLYGQEQLTLSHRSTVWNDRADDLHAAAAFLRLSSGTPEAQRVANSLDAYAEDIDDGLRLMNDTVARRSLEDAAARQPGGPLGKAP